jgi:signal transduction histidine kinase
LYYSRLCLSSFQSANFPAQELKAFLYIHELFAKQNVLDSAYKYLSMATVLKDSLFNQDKTRRAQNLQFNEILRLQKLAQQRKEAQQRYATRVKLYSLIAGSFLLMLIAFILYRNNQQKQKAKLKIEKAYEELKVTQAQLVQREKMAALGELTAGIAHEIQNPLNFVNNFAEVNDDLLDEMRESIDQGDTEEAKAIATYLKENNSKISHHGRRADAIVKGMLQHSRGGKGEKQPTDINALCDEYLGLAYHGVRAKDKSFEAKLLTDFDSRIGKINVVPQEIGRVLLNLFSNAFYALQQKKQMLRDVYEPNVLVSTKKVNGKVEIHVRDNGTGIPQLTLDKIFQPFFTSKPAGQGTGLGLSLAYDIIKAHGGEIMVTSQEDEGTEFIIELVLT